MASGINATFRQIGIATGIAGLGAIFQHQLSSQVSQRLGGTFEPADLEAISRGITNGNAGAVLSRFPAAAQEKGFNEITASFVHAFDFISLVAALVAFAGAIVVVATVRKKDFVSGGHAPTAGK